MRGRQSFNARKKLFVDHSKEMNRQTLHNMYDHEEFGVMAEDRKCEKIKQAIKIIFYAFYISTSIYLLLLIFFKKEEFLALLDEKKNFLRYVILISVIGLIKMCKLIFAIYELILWSNKQTNPLSHNLAFRLWFRFLMSIFEIMCLVVIVTIIKKTDFGKSIFRFKFDVELTLEEELARIMVGIYLINSVLIFIYHSGLAIFIVGAYIYLKCNNSSFE